MAIKILVFFFALSVPANESGHASSHQESHPVTAPATLEHAEKVEKTEAKTETSCGVLESYGGIIQVMSSNLERLIETKGKTLVPCGGWISTDAGWTILKHEKGFKLHIGPWSFVQVMEGAGETDAFTLFRGEVVARAERGQGELRIVTANARARIRSAMAMVSYSNKDENSQMTILLQHDRKVNSTFENRHVRASGVDLKAGELSGMSLQMLRVVPSTPKVVAFNLLKPKLYDFHLDDKEIAASSKQMKGRADRRFASDFYIKDQVENEPNENIVVIKEHTLAKGGKKTATGRKVASVKECQQKAFEKVDKAEALRKKREETEQRAEKARLMQEMSKLTPDE